MMRWVREKWAACCGGFFLRRGRLRRWLTERFLPMWAKETLLAENERLRRELDHQSAECDRLRRYADGLEAGLRAVRGIRISVTMKEKGGADDGDRPGAG